MTDDNITVKRLYSLIGVLEDVIDGIDDIIVDIESGDADPGEAAHRTNEYIEQITIAAE